MLLLFFFLFCVEYITAEVTAVIRSSTLTLQFVNKKKAKSLELLMDEATRVVNLYIEELWKRKDFSSKFVDFSIEDTWLSARMQQCLGKQALQIVKSQRQKYKKTKPVFCGSALELDGRFVDIAFENNSFDVWVKLSSLGNKMILKLPSKKHRHFNKFFEDETWTLKKSIRLRRIKDSNKLVIDLFFEKESPPLKANGKAVGFDSGYHKLLADSDGNIWDLGLEKMYEKIDRKQKNSKAFKRALTERTHLTNKTVKSIPMEGIKTVVVEDLTGLKKNTRHKTTKKFRRKQQRWLYPKVLDRLERICEENGVEFIRIDPAYTSQKCSSCGEVIKKSRRGETFKCASCGMKMDADFNASVNILRRGVYSPSTTEYHS